MAKKHSSGFDRRGFLELIERVGVLKRGDFTLKSGRQSSVFIDFGAFSHGGDLQELGNHFADFIIEQGYDDIDALFGPSYKGITISTFTSAALSEVHNTDIPFIFNRKERKSYGEASAFLGADPSECNRVLVLDDVITDGGTKHEVIDMLSSFNLDIVSIVVGVDRQESDESGSLLVDKFMEDTGVNVDALATMEHVT